jgi:RimJ/RimL family protein N-acetyltransferase
VKQTYILPDYPNRDDAKPLFERLLSLSHEPDRYVAAICLDGSCIGMVNDTEIKGDSVEMGYAILPAFHNRGYCTEMLRGAIGYLHSHGFSRVLTAAFESNKASLRVMEKCGMTLLPETEDLTYRGVTHRCIYYCAAREDNL